MQGELVSSFEFHKAYRSDGPYLILGDSGVCAPCRKLGFIRCDYPAIWRRKSGKAAAPPMVIGERIVS